MPLPLSHSLAGASIQMAADPGEPGLGRRLVAAIVVANAPDLDMLPGLLVGDPNRFHQGASHSLTAAMVAGIVVWLLLRARASAGSRRIARSGGLLAGLVWSSHLLLDMFTADYRAPVGIPLLWPLSDAHFQLPTLFYNVEKLVGSGGIAEFLISLVTWHNARAVAWEALIMIPVLLGALWWHRRRGD